MRKKRSMSDGAWSILFIIMIVGSIALLALLTGGCKAKERIVYVPMHTVSYEKVVVRDTVMDVRLVPYKDSVTVKDTSSFLEDKYAYSRAVWSPHIGMLSHSLAIKDVPHKIVTKVVEVTKVDSIPYEVFIEGPVKIVEKELSWYQRMSVWVTTILIIIIVAYVVYRFRSPLGSLLNIVKKK